MGKLKALGGRLTVLPPRLAFARDGEGHSPTLEPWRAWYKLARWLRLRRRVFVRDHYTCQMSGCGVVTAEPHADHIQEHRGDPALFWADANVQTLCPPCHNRLKQREEAARRRGGG